MKPSNHYIAAVDIGTTKIVTIVGRKNEKGKLEILGMAKTISTGVKRGVVQNIEETVNAIQATIAEVQEKSGIRFTDVFVGIAGQHIRSMRNRGYINRDSYDTEIRKEDIIKLIEDMFKLPVDVGEEIIHVLPQSFTVDTEAGIKNPVGMFGKRLEANFHIVIGQVASARNIEKCINRTGLGVHDLILEPLASAEAVLTADEKEAGVILVDIGGGTTDVAVYYDDIIRHTAVIPFGGNVITNDIKEGCSILNRQAEALKVQFGSALGDMAQDDKVVTIPGISGRDPKEISFKTLAYIIQSRMEEIIDAVMFEAENSDQLDRLSAGIVITGGGALLKHLPQLVKFKTGMDVRIGFPNEHLSLESSEELNHPMYATSIGLLLKGFEYLENNLIKGKDSTAKPEVQPNEEVVKDLAIEAGKASAEKNEQKSRTRMFEAVKDFITNIFDETDVPMS